MMVECDIGLYTIIIKPTWRQALLFLFTMSMDRCSGVSRGVFWLPGNPPSAMICFNQRGDTVLAPTLTSHFHLRRSETPLETNSGYTTAMYMYVPYISGCLPNEAIVETRGFSTQCQHIVLVTISDENIVVFGLTARYYLYKC